MLDSQTSQAPAIPADPANALPTIPEPKFPQFNDVDLVDERQALDDHISAQLERLKPLFALRDAMTHEITNRILTKQTEPPKPGANLQLLHPRYEPVIKRSSKTIYDPIIIQEILKLDISKERMDKAIRWDTPPPPEPVLKTHKTQLGILARDIAEVDAILKRAERTIEGPWELTITPKQQKVLDNGLGRSEESGRSSVEAIDGNGS